MNPVFSALVLGHLRHERLRAVVTLVAVALGVAIALAIDLANATAIASFSSSVNIVSNQINLQVLGVGRGFDDGVLTRVSAVPGVTYAGPTIEGSLVVGAKPGDPLSGEILRILGVDLLRPLPHAQSESASVNSPSGASANAPDPDLLVNRRGAIVSARVAQRYHLRRGDVLAALAGDRTERLRVAETLPAGIAGLDSSVVFVDIATAQELFGKIGRLDRIDCIVDPARLAGVMSAVRAVLPPGVRAIEPTVRTGEIRRMLRSFQLNLQALSSIALLVGMYLIYNTVAISVVQRRPEIGTLRALGTTRRAIFAAFVGEGAIFGVIGAGLGLLLGAFLAQFSVGAVARTVDTMYVATSADHVIYDPVSLARAFAIGVVLAIVSATIPALEAARTAPALTMRSRGFESRIPHFGLRAALAGVGALLLAYACTFAPAIDGVPVFGYVSGLFIIFGGSLCMPIAIETMARIGRALFGSAAGQLAAGNFGAALRRNSVAVASLVVAIGMMASVAILIGSFRTTVVAWADETLRADLFVRPLGLADASFDATFSPKVAATLARVPGVAAVDTFRGISIPFRDRLTTLAAADFTTIAERNKLRFIDVGDTRALARTLPNSDGAVISEPFATRFAMRRGDRFDLDTPTGRHTFTVAAIYNDYSTDAGVAIIDTRTFARLYHDDSINSIAIYAKPGVDLVDLRTRAIRSVRPLSIDVQTTRELRKLVIAIFNRTFAITYALYVISITIALLGVVSTLFALVLERKREIGVMRYLGLRVRDVRRMVLTEAALIGILGGAGGIAVGGLLALLLIFVINRQAFGWLIELHVPWDFLGMSFVIVVVMALLAGIFPARIAARIATAEAVRTE